MKACRVCGRLYPDDAGFCPAEGQELYSVTQVPVASDDADPRVGTLLCERYQIRRVVADGGMGRVYEALDMIEQRNVAAKILHAENSQNKVAVARFKREFAVSKQLPHEHVVEVLDFQPTSDGSFALVMEFLYGEDLRAMLKREKVVAPARLVRVLSQVAIGLDAAHERKLVHRDLKPDNLFLCQTTVGDIVKILDFGSVKDSRRGAEQLTLLGTTIGSPFYMSPEQAQGLATLDQRADVWALGAMAYECLTGMVPFIGTNAPSILMAILTRQPVAPSAAATHGRFAIPKAVDGAVLAALTKRLARRTASAGAFAEEIGHAFGLEGTHVEWARTDQADLDAKISSKLPELMQVSTEPVTEAVLEAISTHKADSQELAPARGRSGWWLVPVVVAIAAIIGVLVAWLI